MPRSAFMWLFAAGVIVFLAVALTGFSQVPGEPLTVLPGVERGIAPDTGEAAFPDRLSIALASPDYPVTPGDTYELTFRAGGEITTSVVMVESDYQLNLNILGLINTRDMVYPELRQEVEQMVRDAYPQSMPSFRLIAVGLFEVTVRGAIEETTRSTAWGLSRVSSIVQPLFRSFSSTRRVLLESRGRPPRTFDLFRAINSGATEEDPRLKPGDSVRVLPVGPLVTVRGEVNEPGRYEILPGEALTNAITHARGFTRDADRSAVQLARLQDGRSSIEVYDLSGGAAESPILRDGDQIRVDTSLRDRAFVFVEGALQIEEPAAPTTQTVEIIEEDLQDIEMSYVRIAELHYDGLLLSDLLSQLRERITSFADLGRTAVIRDRTGDVIEVDASRLLYGGRRGEDLILEPFDTIFIPSRRVSVLVSGPVGEPGLYLYVPGQSAEYYIRRAGGYDREVSATGEYMILDTEGNERPPGSKVQPGDRVEVQRNNFVYQFNRHFPVIISGLTIVTTVISVLTLINQ